MLEYYLIMLTGAAVLATCCGAYLYLRFRQGPRDYRQERWWPGHGIDATRIADRMRRVRSDYAPELRARPGSCRRTGLLPSVRRSIRGLPYFRSYIKRVGVIDDTENHAA